MKLETAKSLILVVLIGTSMILTFGMWNYQTDYDPLSERSVEGDLGGEKMNVEEVIMPSDIVFKSGGSYFGHSSPEYMETFYETIQDFRITEVRTMEYGDERIPDNNEIEVIFPQEIAFPVLEKILEFEDESALIPTFSIDRFYITFEQNSNSLRLEFISVDGREKVEAEVNSSTRFEQLTSEMANLQSEQYQSLTYVEGANQDIYIPRNVPAMHPFSIFFQSMNKSVIQEILFDNPSIVRGSSTPSNGYLYMTDVRQLRIERNVMEYIFLVSDQTESVSDYDLVQRSIDHINGHSGFTEDYRLMNVDNDTISYQMYYDGYPVYRGSSPDIATMNQTFINQQLVEYKRPVITLDMTDKIPQAKKELRTAEEVLEDIAIESDTSLESINDIKVGYSIQVETDENGDYVSMEPEWFMKVNNTWTVIPKDPPNAAIQGGD